MLKPAVSISSTEAMRGESAKHFGATIKSTTSNSRGEKIAERGIATIFLHPIRRVRQ